MQLHFTKLSLWLSMLLLIIYLTGEAVLAGVSEPAPVLKSSPSFQYSQQISQDCKHLEGILNEQKEFISEEIGKVRREMAFLRQELSAPGFREIVAGIGYIIGLAGIAFFLQSRKSGQR